MPARGYAALVDSSRTSAAKTCRQFLRIDLQHLSDDHVRLTGITHDLYSGMIQGAVREQLSSRPPVDIRITPKEAPTLRSRVHLSERPFSSNSELQLLANLDGRPVEPLKGIKAPFFLRPLADGDWQITVSDGAWTKTLSQSLVNFGQLIHLWNATR
ncbi:MAG TPA: hypothetical protein VFT22_16860 [Kofleriaceae bacterium]|nr:hypothetical protein [Kofleriaceae bacterium]